ncbi:MAG: single-stranded-DNA-specific exonuclease RecJ [bacterium]
MQRRWIFPGVLDAVALAKVRREAEVPHFLAELLFKRGVTDGDAAAAYLKPRLRSLSAPELLPEMDLAVARICAAMDRRKRIVLYGDYDVDGITSLAILARFFKACGLDVPCFLPLRAGEGYGLSEAGVERCVEMHAPELLLAVDCGTTSVREIAALRDRGVDVIVLDHHEPGAARPPCTALVNPKCGASFHYLCSAGVVFKLAHAILKAKPVPGVDLREFLDLVALATVADIVPLVEENRIFVSHGLRQMERTRWAGLAALRDVADVSTPVRAGDISFRMGPRINAAGRLGPAMEALQLLLCDDPVEASRLARGLDAHNRERQLVERQVVRDAEEWVSKHFDPGVHASIVAGSREWHIGVLGVVASRIMRQYHRPTFVIGFDESGAGKGSGRSIEGLPLVSMLRDCAAHLEKFGGHDMAAGISLNESSLAAFREAFECAARAIASEEMLVPSLRLDCELALDDIDSSVLESQDLLEPFGNSNTQPVMFSRSVAPAGEPRLMKEKHLRIELQCGRRRVPAVYFNAPVDSMPRPPWDIAYTLDWNVWQGRSEPQLRIVEVRHAE